MNLLTHLFYKKSNELLVLDNCTFFLKLEHFEIGRTYIFFDSDRYKVEEVGDYWIQDYVRDINRYTGYISFPLPQYGFEEKIQAHPSEEVAIIGYDRRRRYHIYGISIGNTNMTISSESWFSASFKFNAYEISYS